MRRSMIYLIVIVVVAAVVWWQWPGRTGLNEPIDPNSVESIAVWGPATGMSMAKLPPDQAPQMIAWFNRGTDPRLNEQPAGVTPAVGMQIKFKNGKQMSILPHGETEVEVQDLRAAKPRYYWLKQPDLAAFLRKLQRPLAA